MKKRVFKTIKGITSATVFLFLIMGFVDVVRFPECYSTTSKYQLKNAIKKGDEKAIEYYETVYLKNNRILFEDFKAQTPVDAKEQKQTQEQEEAPVLENLGQFKITAYCPCAECCGKVDGITKSGTIATEGRTIAVDTSIIPLGTKVIIGGNEYVAEDIGSAIKGNKIDVFFDSHETALNFGVQYENIYIEKGVL